MNIVVIKGNLVRDPELKIVGGSGGKETTVVNFTVAVNRFFKRADGTKDKEATFLDCEAWDSGAKSISEMFSKGDPILVNGSLKVSSWTTDEGQKRSRTKIRVGGFEKLARSTNTSTTADAPESGSPADAATAVAAVTPDGEDIPF